MNNKELKQIRGQIRQIVKEILPEILAMELLLAMENKLSGEIKEALKKIDERQKDLQAYMIRASVLRDQNKS